MGLISSKVERINQKVMAVPMLNLSVGSGGALGARQSDTSPASFAGDYVPIAVFYVESHAYVHMIKQNGLSRFIHPASLRESVFSGGRMLWHPDFFTPPIGTSEPRLKAKIVPPQSPVVSLLFRPFPNNTVEIRLARAISEQDLSGRTAHTVSAAEWSAGTSPTVEVEGMKHTVTQKPSADWKQIQPPSPEPPLSTYEIGASTMLRVSLNLGPGTGMQQGATGEFAFAGEYVPIEISSNNAAQTAIMIKRADVREAAMRGSPGSLYHPDFFFPPLLGGKGGPKQIPGKLKPSAPVVTIVRPLASNAGAEFTFSRVKSDTAKTQSAKVTTRGRSYNVEIEGIPFSVTLIPDRTRVSLPGFQ
jgi:hypothetical protein